MNIERLVMRCDMCGAYIGMEMDGQFYPVSEYGGNRDGRELCIECLEKEETQEDSGWIIDYLEKEEEEDGRSNS